jgi:signal transduction histidine kinase
VTRMVTNLRSVASDLVDRVPSPTPPEAEGARSERKQTDESLRVERARVDDALAEGLTAIDETADAVISRARARADEVLAAARATTDRQSTTSAATAIIESARAREDTALREERAHADDTLREERAEHVALLSSERDETTKALFRERARSDGAVAKRDEFLGIVSHDLRSMLHVVVGFARLIETGVSRADHVEQVLMDARRILRSGVRMDRLIGDLVDVASIEAGMLALTPEVGDPAEVVREVVDTFQARASARGVSLVTEIVPPASLAVFDPARILQVITNLLSNAIKFTQANGTVVVRVERMGDETRVTVRDTGMGIAGDQLNAVFERFLQVARNDRRGVGLGLYISKCIVQGHGGRIWAESRVGEGSTFCFTLPVPG